MPHLWRFALAGSLLLGLTTCAVVERAEPAVTEGERVAERYLDAIEARDWAAMAGFLSVDSVYRDPTMTHFEGLEPIELHGAKAIVEFWRKSSEDTDAVVDNVVTTRFTAGPWVTLVLRPRIELDGESWDLPGERIRGTFDQVTVLEVHGGRIRTHVDYVDYAEVMGLIEAARKGH